MIWETGNKVLGDASECCVQRERVTISPYIQWFYRAKCSRDAESKWGKEILAVLPFNLINWLEGTLGISTVQLHLLLL